MKRNQLNRVQARALEDYILHRWPEIAEKRPRADKFAGEAGLALGMEVSEGNVLGAAKALGKSWPLPDHLRKTLAKRRSISVDAVITLSAAVAGLYIQLGVSPPADLEELCKRAGDIKRKLSQAAPTIDIRGNKVG